MKYIEDYVAHFVSYSIRFSNFDEKIANSLGLQCFENKPFTAKQADVALRLLKKYKSQFITQGYTQISEILENPVYKFPFRVVDNQKLVYIDHGIKKFRLKFPFDQDLVTKIRGINGKKGMFKSEWDADAKQWVMELNEASLKFIIDELSTRNFETSEEVSELIVKYQEITENFENYIPMLVKENDNYIFKNLKSKFSSIDLLSALVESAKFGIHVYDDQICEEIERLNQKMPLSKVFRHEDKQNFCVNKNEYTRNELVTFAKAMDTTVAVFLDENTSAETLQMWVHSLVSCGVDLDDVGVFCRRKNDTGGIEFNSVVKNYNLNKSATDEVKWLFLMTKYPKSLIKNGKVADICIFDNRYVNPHYTVRSVVKNSIYNFLHNDHVTKGEDFVVL